MPRSKFKYYLFFFAKQLLCCLILCGIIFQNAKAQTHKIDSLKKLIIIAPDNKQKLHAILALCEESNSMHIDTLFHYASLGKQMASDAGDENKIIMANVFIETWLARKNLFDSALSLCNQDLKKISYSSAPDIYGKVNMQKCYLLMRTNKREEALSYTYHFLSEAEAGQDTISQIFCKSIIGSVYRSMQQTEPALQWFYKAANTGSNSLFDERKNAFGVFLQIGGMYNWKAVADSSQNEVTKDSAMSLDYLDKTIADSRKFQNIGILARALCMKADALEDSVHIVLAGAYLKEAIHIYDELHDTLSILNGITAMSDYYLSSGQPDKGIAACKQGIEIVNRGFAFPLTEIYWTLSQCYKKAGDYEKYAETLNAIIDLNNATYKKNSEQDLAELNAKYELSNKEAFIVKQKLELLHKDIWIWSSVIITFLILAGAWILFRRNRRKQITALKDAEEKERKRIAADLHDNLGTYATAISANVDEMESKNSTNDTVLLNNLKEYATQIITSLRDTIWVLNKQSISLTGISDRIKNYVQKIQPAYNAVHIYVEENIKREFEFSPSQALHIFRIVQEGLHNALKHSNCSTILVHIIYNELLIIKIEDNGKGFDTGLTYISGNGLTNMKERSAEAGFNILFEKISQGGTRITLTYHGENNKI